MFFRNQSPLVLFIEASIGFETTFKDRQAEYVSIDVKYRYGTNEKGEETMRIQIPSTLPVKKMSNKLLNVRLSDPTFSTYSYECQRGFLGKDFWRSNLFCVKKSDLYQKFQDLCSILRLQMPFYSQRERVTLLQNEAAKEDIKETMEFRAQLLNVNQDKYNLFNCPSLIEDRTPPLRTINRYIETTQLKEKQQLPLKAPIRTRQVNSTQYLKDGNMKKERQSKAIRKQMPQDRIVNHAKPAKTVAKTVAKKETEIESV